MTASDANALEAMLDLEHPTKLAAAEWAASRIGESRPVDRTMWRDFAELGVQGLMMPTSVGGADRSIVEALLTFEGLGLGSPDNGAIFALSSQVIAMQSAFRSAASDEQMRRFGPGLVSGELFGSFAMTEPTAGSDSSAITTTATKSESPTGEVTYELTGQKCWITLGPLADVVVVFATTDPSLGRWGVTAFVIETERAGITRGPAIDKMGLTSSPFGLIDFDRCRVTEDDRLGPEGAGGGIFTAAVEGERAFLYASQLGASERVLNATIERARSREQFGAPIGANQAVSHRIAEMKLRHEASRLLVYKTAALKAAGRSVTMAAALAKLQASESAVESSLDAIRIHGAEGYTTRLPIEEHLRDAVGGLSFSGTSDIQRMIVARLLRTDSPVRPTDASTTNT